MCTSILCPQSAENIGSPMPAHMYYLRIYVELMESKLFPIIKKTEYRKLVYSRYMFLALSIVVLLLSENNAPQASI